jgi:serine/threonine-protein kinase
MDKNKTIEYWREARKHIENYIDLPIKDALDIIKQDSKLNTDVKNILLKLLESQPSGDTITSEADLSLFRIVKNREEDLSGKSIGEYRLIEKIGQGGMSCVYKAKRKGTEIQKFVALKLLVSIEDELNVRLQNLFSQEQLTLSKLHHSNIISFHHGGLSQNGIPYLVMEYIEDAQTIKEYVDTNHLSVNEIVNLIQQIASALDYAHKNLIIHKDIKPSNILIDTLGTPKVVDFGIASFTNNLIELNSNSDNIFTPDYASPEQIKNEALSPSSDIFSLSAVFLELLTNKKPLPPIDIHNYKSSEDKIHIIKLLNQTDIDTDLKNIVIKGLALKPKDRYQRMDALIEDLNNWKDLKTVSATKKTIFYTASKFIQRHKALTFITALSFTLLTTGLFYALQQRRNALLEANKAQQVTNFLIDSIQASDPDLTKGEETSVKELLLNAKIQMQSANIDNPQLASSLKQTIGNALFKIGEYTQAQNLLKSAIKLDADNYVAQIDLARVYINQKLFSQAQKQFELLEKRERTFSKTQQRQLDRLKSLLFFNQGQFGEAKKVIAQSNQTLLKNDHKDYVENNKILAQILNETGEFNQAIKLLRETLDYSKKHFGKLSTQSTQLSHLLAAQLTNQKSTPWDEIQQIYLGTIENEEKLFGSNHPSVAKTHLEFGFVLRMNGKLDKAEFHAKKAYKIAYEQFGENHMLTAHVNVLLSQLKSLQHKLPAAIEQISHALEIYQQHYGMDHFETNQLMTTLSVYLIQNKESQRAISILEPLIQSQTKQLGTDNKATIYSRLTLTKALLASQEFEKAIAIGENALKISEEALGKDIMLTISTQLTLADIYLQNKDYQKAITYSQELLNRGQVLKISAYYKKIAYTLLQAFIANGESEKAQILIDNLMDKFYQTDESHDPYYQKYMAIKT